MDGLRQESLHSADGYEGLDPMDQFSDLPTTRSTAGPAAAMLADGGPQAQRAEFALCYRDIVALLAAQEQEPPPREGASAEQAQGEQSPQQQQSCALADCDVTFGDEPALCCTPSTSPQQHTPRSGQRSQQQHQQQQQKERTLRQRIACHCAACAYTPAAVAARAAGLRRRTGSSASQ